MNDEMVKRWDSNFQDCGYAEKHGFDMVQEAQGKYVLYSDYANLETENLEQARLLAMSGEREARLLARLAAYENTKASEAPR